MVFIFTWKPDFSCDVTKFFETEFSNRYVSGWWPGEKIVKKFGALNVCTGCFIKKITEPVHGHLNGNNSAKYCLIEIFENICDRWFVIVGKMQKWNGFPLYRFRYRFLKSFQGFHCLHIDSRSNQHFRKMHFRIGDIALSHWKQIIFFSVSCWYTRAGG